jgi:hypothetical protein
VGSPGWLMGPLYSALSLSFLHKGRGWLGGKDAPMAVPMQDSELRAVLSIQRCGWQVLRVEARNPPQRRTLAL